MGPDSSLIFEAHLLILEDPTLVGSLEAVIRDERPGPNGPIQANARYEQLFESLTDDYFRQRKSDVSDVLKRVYRNLETKREKEKAPQKQHILVAHELLPSEAALRLSKELTLGVVLDVGGGPRTRPSWPGPSASRPSSDCGTLRARSGRASSSSSTGPTARSSSTRRRPSAASSRPRKKIRDLPAGAPEDGQA